MWRFKMKILFLTTKYLCYESNTVFIDEMIKALKKLNVHVEVCEVMDEESAPEILEQLCGREYDACIDFNTVAPMAMLEDGTFFLDTIKAPFFNYVVDHPFYHHSVLRIPLKNYHVLCLDRNHVKYIEEHYKHIKSAHFLPLGAMKGMIDLPFEKKDTELLFTGTYYLTDDVYMNQIKKHPMSEQQDMRAIIDMMFANPSLTMEACLEKLLLDSGKQLEPFAFAELMNRYHQAEFYVRAHNRHKMVDSILEAGIPITIIGNQWDAYHTSHRKYLTIKEPVGYALSLEMILHAKMLLNILPNFKDGIHDRVLSAMYNRTISITDQSRYLQEQFLSDDEIIFYDLAHMEKLPDQILKLKNDPYKMEKMTEQAYKKVSSMFTWEVRMRELLKIISNLK